MSFPNDFDSNIYRDVNKHLINFTDNELIKHYEYYGYYEGLVSCSISGRNDFINLIKNMNFNYGIEIGPLHSPVLNKGIVNNSKCLDYFSQDELRENYKNDKNVNINNIMFVDYIMRDIKKYTDIISDKFDICFSSHNIEHSPCLITFLKNISDILIKNGYIFLCIPDYRFCFDTYRNPSTIFDVLNAYYLNIDKPTSINRLEQMFFTTHNNNGDHWLEYEKTFKNQFISLNNKDTFMKERTEIIINNIDNIKDIINNNNQYFDSHCWKLNPKIFEHIIEILSKTNFIDLKLIKIYKTIKNSNEFYVILQKI